MLDGLVDQGCNKAYAKQEGHIAHQEGNKFHTHSPLVRPQFAALNQNYLTRASFSMGDGRFDFAKPVLNSATGLVMVTLEP